MLSSISILLFIFDYANRSTVSEDYKAEKLQEETEKPKKNKDRVQRAYFLDRDIDKALRRMALEREKNLTETINEVLQEGLSGFLE